MDLQFNGVNASSLGFTLLDVFIPPLPEEEVDDISIPDDDGVEEMGIKFSIREITVKGILDGEDSEDLVSKMSAFNAFLYSPVPAELIFNNFISDKYFIGRVINPSAPVIHASHAEYEITFTCKDPFAYAITGDSYDSEITLNGDTVLVSNSGHYFAKPLITITFNQEQSHIYIRNQSVSGNGIDIGRAFEIDDILEIDCKNKTVKLNGTPDYLGVGDGGFSLAKWIILAKGNNLVEIGTDDVDIDISVSIEFNKSYF